MQHRLHNHQGYKHPKMQCFSLVLKVLVGRTFSSLRHWDLIWPSEPLDVCSPDTGKGLSTRERLQRIEAKVRQMEQTLGLDNPQVPFTPWQLPCNLSCAPQVC